MQIDGKTKIVGLLGEHIDYTLSPAMHNALFQALNLNYVYLPFPIKPYMLEKALIGLKALNIRGVNVTIPYKEEVIKYLDELDPSSRLIGAVNTIKINDKLIGYNTDGKGFIASLKELGISPRDKNIFLIGCGGAGRAVSLTLATTGAKRIVLTDKVMDKAESLYNAIKRFTSTAIIDISCKTVKDYISTTDILINATSVGMKEEDPLPIPEELLHDRLFVYDLIYNPPKTKLLEHALKKGARISNGISMLVHQGAFSFEIWTGIKPPIDVMMKAVELSNLS
ncbi:MAG: shikimate dehydrogenase [bacterium]|nr:shikimate dehydrogenase [bacterium]